MSNNGIFNVPEPTKEAEFQTTAAQAQADAKTAPIAHEIEANAEQAKDAAQNAAHVAQSKGSELTGQTAADRLQTDVAVKTGAAVDQGQQDFEAAKASGAGYVEQAKTMASNAVASAQSYIPPGSGPNGQHTAGDVVSGLQAGATAAISTTKDILVAATETAKPYVLSAAETAKPYVVSAAGTVQSTAASAAGTVQSTAQPHLERARDAAASYLPGSTTTQTAPVEGKDTTVV
ncbi:hypothetical protein B0H16DRAFT_34505 [Mycena metata]|uniref:Uncharacterized protein n=1 Tax=Mycena metata TaxID=1033252 RepID=A0AAD7P3M8_9AGAR|nr:hypothetical protein B0H16DRAFT_34505 [Mycena metata]